VAVQFTLPSLLDLDSIERWYSKNNPNGILIEVIVHGRQDIKGLFEDE
jgi:hypothetical protein